MQFRFSYAKLGEKKSWRSYQPNFDPLDKHDWGWTIAKLLPNMEKKNFLEDCGTGFVWLGIPRLTFYPFLGWGFVFIARLFLLLVISIDFPTQLTATLSQTPVSVSSWQRKSLLFFLSTEGSTPDVRHQPTQFTCRWTSAGTTAIQPWVNLSTRHHNLALP